MTDLIEAERARMRMPKRLGLFELNIGRERHLIAINLDSSGIVGFFPSGNGQLSTIQEFIFAGSKNDLPDEISIPCDLDIATLLNRLCPQSTISYSQIAQQHLVGQGLIVSYASRPRNRRTKGVSLKDSLLLSRRRFEELDDASKDEFKRGIQAKEVYWLAFEFKEALLESLNLNSDSCLYSGQSLMLNTTEVNRQMFSSVFNCLAQLERLKVTYKGIDSLPEMTRKLQTLQHYIVRPGHGFSLPILEALIALFLGIGFARNSLIEALKETASEFISIFELLLQTQKEYVLGQVFIEVCGRAHTLNNYSDSRI